MCLTKNDMQRLHRLSSDSKYQLKDAHILGCFSCLNKFTYDAIETFVDVDRTALCPYCDIDAVLPLNALGKEADYDKTLEAMHRYFF